MNILYLESLILVIIFLVVLFIANVRYWRPLIFNRLSLIYIFAVLSSSLYMGRVIVEGRFVVLNKIFVVLSCLSLMAICMSYYYFVLQHVGKTWKNAKFWYISSFVPALIVTVLFSISCWFNDGSAAFYVDNNGVYHSGQLFFALLIVSYAYIVCGIVFSAMKALHVDLLSEKHKFTTMALAIIPSLVLAVLNNIFPYPNGLPFVFYGVVISLFILFAASSAGRITRDSLTGLLNRFAFDTSLSQAVKKSVKNIQPQSGLWLLIIDINDFKEVNDTFGHAVGDEVLIKFSKSAQNVCEKYNATLGRWGGDEFVAFLETEDTKVGEFQNVLKQTIRDECNDDPRFIVSISIGASKLREYETTKHFFDEADHKLYEDKRKFHQENQSSIISSEEVKM